MSKITFNQLKELIEFEAEVSREVVKHKLTEDITDVQYAYYDGVARVFNTLKNCIEDEEFYHEHLACIEREIEALEVEMWGNEYDKD